jgi:hypothetical protein
MSSFTTVASGTMEASGRHLTLRPPLPLPTTLLNPPAECGATESVTVPLREEAAQASTVHLSAPAARILSRIAATFSITGSTDTTRLVPPDASQKNCESRPTFAPTSTT